MGRFTSADSIVPAGVQGYDRYAYVNNSPVNFTDPTGHMQENDDDGGIGCDLDCWRDKQQEDETNNPLIDIWNQFGEAGDEFFDNGCDRSISTFWNNATCLDSASLVTQDVATLFSSAGAAATSITTLLGCAAPADFEIGCGVGYVVGVGIHTTFFNGPETVASMASFVTTVRSDYLTDDTYFNSLQDWGVGEDTITGAFTVVPGTLTVNPFIDVGADIYASGYNHGYFCGMSTILDCLP